MRRVGRSGSKFQRQTQVETLSALHHDPGARGRLWRRREGPVALRAAGPVKMSLFVLGGGNFSSARLVQPIGTFFVTNRVFISACSLLTHALFC